MCFRLVGGLYVLLALLLTSPVKAETRNIAYGSDPKQKLDIYPASGTTQTTDHPVVIWVHGGGWRHGDKDNRSGGTLCQTWSAAGVVMVNLNYRLTPDVMHPIHTQDVAAGIAWVHENIAKYGGNPKRIYLLGHSAGAHLVALVATDPSYLKAHQLTPKSALAGVMSIDTASYDLSSTRTPAVRKMIRDAFGTNPETLAAASPLVQAKKNRELCPPFVIATAKQRPEAVQESQALDKVLPNSKLIVMDYPNQGQLRAHGDIARDLMDLKNRMTKQLFSFIGMPSER